MTSPSPAQINYFVYMRVFFAGFPAEAFKA
jgi:hypothetical protein